MEGTIKVSCIRVTIFIPRSYPCAFEFQLMKTCFFRIYLYAAAFIVSLYVASAGAQTQTATVIEQLPYTIQSSGNYVLGGNPPLSGQPYADGGITLLYINAPNVTLDLKNYSIIGPGVNGQPNQLYAILAVSCSNLTIKNGTAEGCGYGICLEDCSTVHIDKMRVTACYREGIIVELTSDALVTNCQISEIAGSTNGTIGIQILNSSGTTIADCLIADIIPNPGYNSYCIYSDDSGSPSIIRKNQLANATYGVNYGILQKNLAIGCTMAFPSYNTSTAVDGGRNTHN